jgi:hypothetical protein
MIDLMILVGIGFVLGAACFTAYDFHFQRGKAGFSWVGLLSLFVSLLIDVLATPLLRVPGSPALVLFGLGSGYVLLSSFAFGVMVNFFVSKPLSYFTGKSAFMAGRARISGSAGFWQRRAVDVSQLKQPVTRRFRKLWLVLIVLSVLVPASFAVASIQFQASISTSGNIKAVGISVYSDPLGTVVATKIDWGMLEPGQKVNSTLYLKNTSNVPVFVSLAVGNFNPASGQTYLACTWNYSGGTLNPGVIVPVTLTLTVASTITGITAFSFDLGITGSG